MCPAGLALNPQGTELFVADGDHNRVCVFAPEGVLLRVWGSEGAGFGELQFPRDVKVSAGGDEVYVADRDNHRVCVCFALMGLYCVCWGVGRVRAMASSTCPLVLLSRHTARCWCARTTTTACRS